MLAERRSGATTERFKATVDAGVSSGGLNEGPSRERVIIEQPVEGRADDLRARLAMEPLDISRSQGFN
jgi:hypothetical protein